MLRTRAEHPHSFFFLSGQLIRKLQIAFGSPAQGRRMSQLSSTDKFSVSQRITERSMTFCNSQTMPQPIWIGKKFHCARRKFMFLCNILGMARDNPKGRAEDGHDFNRGEAPTRLEEILEVEPCLSAKARAAQPSRFALRDPRSSCALDGNVGIFRGTRQGNHSGG